MFYVEDPSEKDWHVVIKIASRDLYNMPEKELEGHDDVLYIQNELYDVGEDDDVTWDKSKIPGISIDHNRTI